jgi:hypothetical protein
LVLGGLVKKAVLITLVVFVVAWALVVAIQNSSRDPEITNPADAEESRGKAEQEPEFVASDPSLLVPKGTSIEEQAVDESSGQGLADAPYFIQFSDGRYAYGYADGQGRTRRIYAPQSVSHEVFWYDDAWERRRALREIKPEAGELKP